jgi:hypothetical protein
MSTERLLAIVASVAVVADFILVHGPRLINWGINNMTPSRQMMYNISVNLLLLVALALSVISIYGSWYRRPPIITPPPAPVVAIQQKPPLVTVQALDPQPIGWTPNKTIFKVGKVGINFHFFHSGPNIAAEGFWEDGRPMVEPKPTDATTEIALENVIYAEFKKSLITHGVNDLNIGDDRWFTREVTLTDDDAKQLVKGDKLLYILEYAEFKDANGQHTIEACKFLQPPGNANVWHLCNAGHNQTK